MTTRQPVAPLTIIAVFAGIIESSALATLPFLSEESQSLYTWFLVGFPFFLTALFFLTLNFNYKSLYKPEHEPVAAHAMAHSPLFSQSPHAEPGRMHFNHAADPVTVMLSGPDAQKMIEQQVLQALTHTPDTGGNWVFCNLDKQLCFRLSAGELPPNAAHLKS
ncbi:hypothetical protein [Pseudomonas sp. PSKL.D1]|uniref:hypothetical protein n=1 Tax=Pseudomonas sp. PSKL.D1 TaxID=3029060 RepID=UPI0023811D65|nr:hypothetical protein [Pseudomonas sp. PSKL.D1]WDY59116.1 hypothetical protein PVV54_05645 [Pseudomonas sp. PSKL.D1]